MSLKKKIPKFNSEEEEREFWATANSIDYINWEIAQPVIFPNLKPTLRSISIRLPEWMINQLKQKANKLDIPYQALVKILIKDGLEKR